MPEETFIGLPAEAQAALTRVLRALVTVSAGDDAAPVRCPAPLADVTSTPQERALVEAFIAARLFTAGLDHPQRDSSPDDAPAVVSITHEALLRHWPRLVRWLEQDRELLRVRQRVSAAAARWDAEGRPADLLLAAGKPLEEARGLLAAGWGIPLASAERSYLSASSSRACASGSGGWRLAHSRACPS